jgi:hypothetical protein
MDVDLDMAREIIILTAKDLGLDDAALTRLDDVICALLKLEDTDPFIFPA